MNNALTANVFYIWLGLVWTPLQLGRLLPTPPPPRSSPKCKAGVFCGSELSDFHGLRGDPMERVRPWGCEVAGAHAVEAQPLGFVTSGKLLDFSELLFLHLCEGLIIISVVNRGGVRGSARNVVSIRYCL